MASGYVTSDGKDLDSRYLGINAKAASAGYADSAGSAAVATSAPNAVPTGVYTPWTSSKRQVVTNSSPLNVTVTIPTKTAFILKGADVRFTNDATQGNHTVSMTITVNGKNVYSNSVTDANTRNTALSLGKEVWIPAGATATIIWRVTSTTKYDCNGSCSANGLVNSSF